MERMQRVEQLGVAQPVTKVFPRHGDEFYLCNPWVAVDRALKAGVMFSADMVVGMKPQGITINPAHISHAEDMLP